MTIPTQTGPYQAPSADDFLFGNGPSRKGRSMRYPMIGTTNSGVICDTPRTEQQRDPDTGDLKFWAPRQGQEIGDPIWQLVVPVQVDLQSNPHLRSQEVAEANNGEDDGVRYFYLSGSKDPASMSSLSAVGVAVRNAGAKGLQIGGRLTVSYVQDMPKRPGASAVSKNPHGYVAQYESPANTMLSQVGAPAQQAQQYQAPAQQYQAPVAQQPVAQAAYQQPQVNYDQTGGAPQNGAQQAAPAAAAGQSREAMIAAEFSHLPENQLRGLLASGLPIETLRTMNIQASS
jgi:hypothetical protein